MASKKTRPTADPAKWSVVVEESPQDSALREVEKVARLRTQELKPPPPYRRLPKRGPVGKTVLVIPDAHATPGPDGTLANNQRFDWVGRAITDPDIAPDVVVSIGDHWSFDSLETYSKPGSKAYFQGYDYHRDVDAGLDGLLRIRAQVDAVNRGRKKSSRTEPKRWVMTGGNHEERIQRLLFSTAIGYRLQGLIGYDDLRLEELGWEWHDYLVPVEIHGVTYSHTFVSGVMGKSISGVHQAASMIQKLHKTVVCGHSHLADHAVRTNSAGEKLHGLVVGCYTEEIMSYASKSVNDLWWRGLVVLRGCDGTGSLDPEWISMERVKQKYG